MFGLLGEFELLDILVVLNFFQNYKTAKAVDKLAKLQTYATLISDDHLDEIIQILRSSK